MNVLLYEALGPDETIDFQKNMRPLPFLRGNPGNTGDVMKDDGRLQKNAAYQWYRLNLIRCNENQGLV